MSADPLAFLDSPAEKISTSEDPLSFLPEYSKSPLRKPARLAAQAGKGALNLIPTVAAYNLATTLEREGAHKSRERVSAQARKDLQRIEEKKSRGESLSRQERLLYDRTKELAERKSEKASGIDTESLINRAVKATTGIDLTPEDLGEELTNIGASIISPRGALRAVQKAPQLFTKAGREALSAERALRKTQAGWTSLSKASKGNPEKEGIINFAQQKGLTPREATLLMQSEKEMKTLGKLSKKTKRFEKDITGLKEKLGASYEEMKDIGRKGGFIGSKEAHALEDELQAMVNDMELTHIVGPDTRAAKKALEEAINDIQMNGSTVEKLIATRQNLGQQINWNAVDPKGTLLKKGREAFAKAVERTNPEIGKQLRQTDKFWAKYQKYQDILDSKQGFIKIKGMPIPNSEIAFGAASLAMGLLHAHPATAIKAYAIKEAIQRFSTALLSNPKLQGVHKQLMQSLLRGDKEQQRKLMIVAQKILKKEDPDLYNELDLQID